MARKSFEYSIKFVSDTTGLKNVLNEIDKIANRAKSVSMTDEMKVATKEAHRLQEILEKAWNPKLSRFNMAQVQSGIKESYGSIQKFGNAMINAGNEGALMYNKIAQQSLTSSIQIKKDNKLITSFAESMKGYIKWFTSSAITNAVVGSISKAYNFTKDLDKALTNIRIVTGKSKDEMADFARYAQKAAVSLSSSTKAYTEASLIYYQQGLSDNEVKARTDTTLKVTNITGMNADTASEQLTAVWNGYKVTSQETELYIDKLAKVASTTASNLQELATGMSKVASTANTVGVNIDQLSAQLSTVISVTRQTPEVVGTAFKTIYARMGDLQVNGEDESGVSLGKVSSTMKELGINILDQKGELRDLGTVIEETMHKWNGWTKAQKEAAAIVMAGTRQYNNLYALFENQDKYNASLKESKNAAGTLQAQQDIYADSTVAKLQKLTAVSEKMYGAMFDQESVKTITSIFTTIIDVLGDFVTGLGGGTAALTKLGTTAMLVFRKQIAQSIQQSIGNVRAWRENINIAKDNLLITQQLLQKKGILRSFVNNTNLQGGSISQQFDVLTANTVTGRTAKLYQDFSGASRYMSSEQQAKQIEQMREYARLQEDISKSNFYKFYEKQTFGIRNPDQVNLDNINQQYEKKRQQLTTNQNNLDAAYSAAILGSSKENIRSLSDESFRFILGLDKNGRLDPSLTSNASVATSVLQKIGKGDLDLTTIEGRKAAVLAIKDAEIEVEKILRRENNLLNQQQKDLKRSQESRKTAMTDAGADVEEKKIKQQQLQDDMRREQEEAKNRKKIATVVTGIAMFGSAVSSATNVIQVFLKTTATASEKLQSVASATTSLGSQIGFTLTSIHPVVGIVVSALSALGGGILQLISSSLHKSEELIKKNANTFSESTDKITELNNSLDSVEQYRVEYEVLAKGVSAAGENLSLTNSQYARFLEISNILGEKFPELISGYDNEGNAIVQTNDAFTELEKSVKEAKAALDTSGLEDYVSTNKTSLTEAQEEEKTNKESAETVFLEEQNSIARDLYLKFSQNDIQLFDGTSVKEYIRQIRSNSSKDISYADALEELATEYVGSNTDIEKAIKDLRLSENTYKNKIKQASTESKRITKETAKKYAEWAETYIDGVEDFNSTQRQTFSAIIQNMDEETAFDTEKGEQFTNEVAAIVKYLDDSDNQVIKNILSDKNNLSYEETIEQVDDIFNRLTPETKRKMGLDENANSSTFYNKIIGRDSLELGTKILSLARELTEWNDISLEEALEYVRTHGSTQEIMDGSITDFAGVDYTKTSINEQKRLDSISKQRTARKQAIEKAQTDYKSVNTILQDITEVQDKSLSDKNISEEDLKKIFAYSGNDSNVLNTISQMKKIRDRNSQEFKDLLSTYLQQMEDLSKQSAVNTIQIASETLNIESQKLSTVLQTANLNFSEMQTMWLEEGEDAVSEFLGKLNISESKKIEIIADLEAYNQVMDQIKDAEYQKTVTIKADIDSDLNEAFSTIDEITSLSDILAKGLTISISDMKNMIENGYGAMLEGATAAADGQIILNREVVNSVVASKQEEFAAELKLQQEKNNLKVEQLEAQKEIAQSEIDMAKRGLSATSATEKAAYIAKATVLDAERKNIENNSTIEWQNKKELSTKEQELATNLNDFLIGQENSLTEEFISLAKSKAKANKVVAQQEIENYQAMAEAAQDYIDGNFEKLKNKTNITYSTVFNDSDVSNSAYEDWKENNKDLAKSISAVEFKLIGGILENSKSDLDVLDSQLQTIIDTQTENISLYDRQIASYKAIGTAGISAYANVTTGLDSLQEAVGETNDLLDDEIDRFHYIDVLLDRVSKSMDKLKDAQERLVGAGLVDNLQQQIDLLEQENSLQEEKRNIAINRANELRGTLANYGAVFDEEGAVANYTDFLINLENQMNTITTEYNSMSKAQQEANEDTYNNLKDTYKDVKDDLEEYEDIVNDTLTDIEDATYENKNAITELKIALSKVESDLALENIDINKSFRDYRSAVIDRVGDKDFQQRINNNLADLEDYYNINGEGKSQIYRQRVENLLEQKRQMESTGSASIYGTNDAQLREDLKQAMSDLMSSQQDFVTKLEDTWNIIVTGAEDAFAVNSNFYENQNAELDFQSKLLGLVGGKTAINQEKIYKAQIELNKGQIEAAKKETNFWNNQLELAKANNAGIDKIRELEDKANEARKQENNLVISSIEDLQNSYKAVIKTTLDENFKAIDDLKDRYDWVKTLNEPWLDDTTRMYEIQKFNLEVKAEIDDTTSEYAQKKLNTVLNDQLEILRTKDKLTQNDVDRANKILDLTKKQIALEEARQNKTRMRLRRDSQGNYNFQYTANEEDINNKTKEYLEATQDIYNMEKEYERETLELMFDFAKTARERLEKVLTDINLTQEEQRAEALRIYQETEEQMKALGDENHYARELLLQDLYEFVLPSLYSTNEENFIQSLEIENSALTTWKELFIQGWIDIGNTGKMTLDTLSATGVAFYQNLSDLDKTTMVETILPEFTESLQMMMDKFTEPDGFNEVTNYAFSECIRLCQEYQQEFNNLGAVAGYNFGQIHNGNWDTITTTEAVRNKVVEVNDALQTQIKKYNDLAWSVWNVEQQFSTFADDTDVFVKGANITLTAWTAAFGGLTNMLRAWSNDLAYGMSNAGRIINWDNAYEAAAGQARDLMNNSVTDISNSSNNSNSNKGQTTTTKSNLPKGYYPQQPPSLASLYYDYTITDGTVTTNPGAYINYQTESTMTFDKDKYEKSKFFLGRVNPIKTLSWSTPSEDLYHVSSTLVGKPLDFIGKTSDGSVVFRVHGMKAGSELVLDASLVKAGVLKSSNPFVEQQLRSFDTGGYTGIWNNSLGKLAVLHEKEIVLNKKDTANLLSTVQIVRDLSPIIQTLNNNLNNRLTYLQSQFTTPSKIINNSSTESNSENVKQYFTINADFPNVENVKDIKEAFEYLSTYGQQYINRRY